MEGQGPVTTETRQVGAFARVEVSAGIGVNATIGQTPSVQVTAQQNILPIIATEVQGETLKIHSTQGYTTSQGVTVTIVNPTLEGFTASGGSQGQATGLADQSLDVALSGGAGLTATGTVTTVSLIASGGAHAELGGLAALTVALDMSGGASATVRAANEVTGTASGGAHVTVVGGAKLNVLTSGGASVSTQ
jgi:Putative auto-transporter adhesin, head GIN domain